ncbi:MAG: DUF5658 family protein [Phycisphaeraceae bacterium]
MSDQEAVPTGRPWARAVHFPDQYGWLVFVSALDLMLTWLILQLGGREVNPLADWILVAAGYPGMVLFKYSVVIFVVLVCEYIARKQLKTARELAWVAVIISGVPVVVALAQIATTFHPGVW